MRETGVKDGLPDIRVNDRVITAGDINRELQYHPADTLTEARRQAALALAIRALLLSEADRLGVTGEHSEEQAVREESRIRCLLERALENPEPDEAACRRYFEKNRERFRSPSRYHVSHIFRPAPADDADARVAARNRCRRLIRVLQQDPARFARLARQHSRCPSRDTDGLLGEVGPGQTCREFEQALDRLPVGELSPHPLETRYGFHVVWLHEREAGEPLGFEAVQPVIADYLRESVWRRSVSQYLRILAARSDIHGIDLDAAQSPLVQ